MPAVVSDRLARMLRELRAEPASRAPTPMDHAVNLVQRVYVVAVESHFLGQRLIAMTAPDQDTEAERVVALGLVGALTAGLHPSLEEAISMMKAGMGDDAEARLRRRLEGLHG